MRYRITRRGYHDEIYTSLPRSARENGILFKDRPTTTVSECILVDGAKEGTTSLNHTRKTQTHVYWS